MCRKSSERFLRQECDLEGLAKQVSFCLQAGAITGFLAAFTEAPIDFYKSQLQVQVIRAQADPNYKRESDRLPKLFGLHRIVSQSLCRIDTDLAHLHCFAVGSCKREPQHLLWTGQ